MKVIQYNPLAIRRVAQECRTEAQSVEITCDTMMGYMSANTGLMREKMDQNISTTQDCMRNTQNLLNEAGNFMAQLADYMERQDRKIAQKMGE